MRLTLEESNEPPENQVLNAEVTSVKHVVKDWVDNKTGEKAERIAVEFTILDDKYAGRKVWEDLFTSFYASPRCKLYDWTLKILNRDELPEGFVMDTSALEGSRVQIMLSTRHYKKKDGTPGSAQNVTLLSQEEAQGMRAAGGGTGLTGGGIQSDLEPAGGIAPLAPAYDPDEPF